MQARLYRLPSVFKLPSVELMSCRCWGTGSIPMPPRGEGEWKQEFLCDLPCPECIAREEREAQWKDQHSRRNTWQA